MSEMSKQNEAQQGARIFRDNLDDYEARKDAQRQAPASANVGLVERMLDAARVDADDWRTYCDEDKRQFIRAMTAALRVAADALLGAPTDEEKHNLRLNSTPEWAMAQLKSIITARRARLLAPAKSERVRDDAQNDPVFSKKYDAEINRLGLIAKLRQEGAE